MKRPQVKFCGITRREDALLAQDLGVNHIGLIFAESPRQVSVSQAQSITGSLDRKTGRVGVFANESLKNLIEVADAVSLTAVQLHGSETPDYSKKLRELRPEITIIKAIEIDEHFSPTLANKFDCDYLLFDSPKNKKIRRSLNLSLVMKHKFNKPFFIAGGLSIENVADQIALARPDGIDICSGIEKQPGVKDLHVMKLFLAAVTAGTL